MFSTSSVSELSGVNWNLSAGGDTSYGGGPSSNYGGAPYSPPIPASIPQALGSGNNMNEVRYHQHIRTISCQ